MSLENRCKLQKVKEIKNRTIFPSKRISQERCTHINGFPVLQVDTTQPQTCARLDPCYLQLEPLDSCLTHPFSQVNPAPHPFSFPSSFHIRKDRNIYSKSYKGLLRVITQPISFTEKRCLLKTKKSKST